MIGTDQIAKRPSADLLCLVAATVIGATAAIASPALAFGLAIFGGLAAVSLIRLSLSWVLFLIIAPWAGLANVLAGGRLVALGLDLFLILCTGLLLLGRDRVRIESDRSLSVANLGLWLVLVIGLTGILNPKGLALLGAMEGFRAFFLPILGLFAGYNIVKRNPRMDSTILTTLVIACCLVAAMGIRQALSPAPLDMAIITNSQTNIMPFQVTGTNRLRAFSPLPGPFHFGLLMMCGLLILFARMQHRMQLSHLAALPLLLVATALNATRLNWFGIAVGAVTLSLVSLDTVRLRRWLVRTATMLVGTSITLLLVLTLDILQPIRSFALSLIDPTTSTSFIFRVAGWRYDILPAILAHPWVGYGTGMAKDGLGPYTSHNLLLKLLIEGGVTLFSAYLVAVVAITVALVRRREHLGARLGLALLVGVHAAGMLGPILDAYPGNLFVWLLLGAALNLEPSIPAQTLQGTSSGEQAFSVLGT